MAESLSPERRTPAESFQQPPALVTATLTAPDPCIARSSSTSRRWCDFSAASSLHLAPLLDRLLEPIACLELSARLRLGLQEALVNAVCHGNGLDPALSLRIRRIECRHWWVFQVQDQGLACPEAAVAAGYPSIQPLQPAGGCFSFSTVSMMCAGVSAATACSWRCDVSVHEWGSQDP